MGGERNKETEKDRVRQRDRDTERVSERHRAYCH